MKKIFFIALCLLTNGIAYAWTNYDANKQTINDPPVQWSSKDINDIISFTNSLDNEVKVQIHVISSAGGGIDLQGKCNGAAHYHFYHLSPNQSIICTVEKTDSPIMNADTNNKVTTGTFKFIDIPT